MTAFPVTTSSAASTEGFPLNLARAAAVKVVRALMPACSRVRVCGSVRRQEDWCGDIDIVVVPHQAVGLFGAPTAAWADDFLNLLCRGGIPPGGTGFQPVRAQTTDKHNQSRSSSPPPTAHCPSPSPPLWTVEGSLTPTSKRITLRSRRSAMKVELWPVFPESFGWMSLIRTGPRQIGTGLMRCAAARGYTAEVQRCSRPSKPGCLEVIPMDTEQQACDALGVRWQPPNTDARLELARDLHAIADAANVPTEASAAPREESAS